MMVGFILNCRGTDMLSTSTRARSGNGNGLFLRQIADEARIGYYIVIAGYCALQVTKGKLCCTNWMIRSNPTRQL